MADRQRVVKQFLVLGSWFLVLGSWFLVLGSWFLVLGGELLVADSKRPLPGRTLISTFEAAKRYQERGGIGDLLSSRLV
jgi:hypothetical protein